jgi:hypothetical protein
MKLADAKWEGSRFHKNRLIDSIPGMMRTEIGEEARCLAEEHGSRFCLVVDDWSAGDGPKFGAR